jgi:hypothetical protein
MSIRNPGFLQRNLFRLLCLSVSQWDAVDKWPAVQWNVDQKGCSKPLRAVNGNATPVILSHMFDECQAQTPVWASGVAALQLLEQQFLPFFRNGRASVVNRKKHPVMRLQS